MAIVAVAANSHLLRQKHQDYAPQHIYTSQGPTLAQQHWQNSRNNLENCRLHNQLHIEHAVQSALCFIKDGFTMHA
jgi:hypothetical protein